MFSSLKELFFLLNSEQRKNLYLLQVLIIIMSFLEVASVLVIGPFVAFLGSSELFYSNKTYLFFFEYFNFKNSNSFIIFISIAVLSIMILSAAVSMFTIWCLSMYGAKVGADLSNRLYKFYIYQPWIFHSTNNSATLTNKISQECLRITNTIISPLLFMNAKLAIIFFISIGILIYDPLISVFGLCIFSFAYLILYSFVRKKYHRNGKVITDGQKTRFKLMSEGFGGIREILLLGRQKHFLNKFFKASDSFAYATGNTSVLSLLPRYAMELLAFGSVIILILFFLIRENSSLITVLPILSIFAMASFKILPAFQQVYANISSIKGNLASFDVLKDDLRNSNKEADISAKLNEEKKWSPKKNIEFKNVFFNYPNISKPALQGMNFEIKINSIIGFVGKSGSGKSTTLDALLGLIFPKSGEILIDKVPLNSSNIRDWQNNIGFVSQNIFLSDNSIRENIAFGIPNELIDEKRITLASQMSLLNDFVSELPNGIDTIIGERGVQISGGQRQRIGIARALYRNCSILVFDEATSSLDGVSEKLIMETINNLSGKKTIILVAHRLSTVKNSECIYLIENGKITDKGNYDQLFEKNLFFKKMALNA
jgi:ATP-binding cassette, subfamily B, bacterial PglK